MLPELPPDLARVFLKVGSAPGRVLGRTDAEGVPEGVLFHLADLATIVYERDRIEVVRVVIGGKTIVAHSEEIAGTRYIVITELMTGHPFMKSLKRWSTRWLRRMSVTDARELEPVDKAGAA